MSPAVGAGRQITIRSISCRGVKSYVPFQTPPLYAAVSLAGRREKTPADPNGSENPEWDHAIRFDLGLDADAQLLQFEVKAQVPLLGNKRVGTAAVPVADLGAPDGAPRYASYQVLAPDGKPNGTLSLYYAISSLPPPANPAFPVTTSFPRQSSYPPPPPPPASTPLYPHLPASDFVLPSCCPPPLSSPAPPPPPNYHPPPPPLSSSAYPALPNPPPYSSYPPPPPPAPAPALMPEPSLAYPALAYSAPSSVPALHYPAISRSPLETRPSEGKAPLGAAGYPPPGTGYPEEAARTPYYPPPGTRYP